VGAACVRARVSVCVCVCVVRAALWARVESTTIERGPAWRERERPESLFSGFVGSIALPVSVSLRVSRGSLQLLFLAVEPPKSWARRIGSRARHVRGFRSVWGS